VIWGLGFLRAMGVTMRNMFRPAMTVQYPDEHLVIPERARWALAHKFDDAGAPKCTACLICERECPDHIIHMTISGDAASGKHIDEYLYELGACMMCGLCVAACPFDAIEMSHEYELATPDPHALVRILLRDVDAASGKRTKTEAAAAAPEPTSPAAAAPPGDREGAGDA
jgi:NADH-quinone oxidoreductase subunit I